MSFAEKKLETPPANSEAELTNQSPVRPILRFNTLKPSHHKRGFARSATDLPCKRVTFRDPHELHTVFEIKPCLHERCHSQTDFVVPKKSKKQKGCECVIQ
jgi:hypothetical protein